MPKLSRSTIEEEPTTVIIEWPLPKHRLEQVLAEQYALEHNGADTAHALTLLDSTVEPNA